MRFGGMLVIASTLALGLAFPLPQISAEQLRKSTKESMLVKYALKFAALDTTDPNFESLAKTIIGLVKGTSHSEHLKDETDLAEAVGRLDDRTCWKGQVLIVLTDFLKVTFPDQIEQRNSAQNKAYNAVQAALQKTNESLCPAPPPQTTFEPGYKGG